DVESSGGRRNSSESVESKTETRESKRRALKHQWTSPRCSPIMAASMVGHSGSGKIPHVSMGFRNGTTWKLAYQRNNKSKGQKNLRCFPNCCLGFGHQDGFCGQSITVHCELDPKELDTSKVMAVGEFAVETSAGHANGALIPLSCVNNHGTEMDAKSSKTYIEGLRVQSKSIMSAQALGGTASLAQPSSSGQSGTMLQYEFNRNLKGWHYGFLGSKKTRNLYHVFRAFLVEKTEKKANGEPLFRVLASCRSPPWQMYCRRRKNNQLAMKEARKAAASTFHLGRSDDISIDAGKVIFTKVSQHQQRQRRNLGGAKTEARDCAEDHGIDFTKISLARQGQITTASASSADKDGGSGSGNGMSLVDNEPSSEFKQHMFLSAQRAAGALPNLTSPSGMFSDSRFERLVDLIKQLDLPEPLQPHKFSLSKDKMEIFAENVCSFLIHWHQMQTLSWPPRLPYRVFEYLNSSSEAKLPLSNQDRFALFLIQQESFRYQVQDFTLRNSPGTRNLDPYQTSVFALKLFTDLFENFIAQQQNSSSLKSELLNAKACASDEQLMGFWNEADPQHRGDYLDISFTPRANFNQEEFDYLQASLQTPRDGNLFSGPSQATQANKAGQKFAILQASALEQQQAQASTALGKESQSSSLPQSIQSQPPLLLPQQKHGQQQQQQVQGTTKALSTLTPRSVFGLTPKNSFMLSPKHSFTLKALGSSDGIPKVDMDFLNLPSPVMKTPRLFAQVDNFLEETKDYNFMMSPSSYVNQGSSSSSSSSSHNSDSKSNKNSPSKATARATSTSPAAATA
ncbi:Uncharacterized protein SCF082_LOCUS52609, partial [Durusdinium trenchii]